MSEPWSGEAEAEEADEDIDVQLPRPAALWGAFLLVDDWNLTDKLKKRASLFERDHSGMPSGWLWKKRRVMTLFARKEGGKLFLLIPRMLLHRPPRGGLIPKEKLRERFEVFARGEWNSLLEASSKCDDDAAARRRKRRQQEGDDLERRGCQGRGTSCRLRDRLLRGRRWREVRATLCRNGRMRRSAHLFHATRCLQRSSITVLGSLVPLTLENV